MTTGLDRAKYRALVEARVFEPDSLRAALAKGPEAGTLNFQEHGSEVRFRNIWVRESKELEGKTGGKVGPDPADRLPGGCV